MTHETHHEHIEGTHCEHCKKQDKKNFLRNAATIITSKYTMPAAIVLSALLVSGAILYTNQAPANPATVAAKQYAKLEKEVLPEKGIVLPVTWGDLGSKLVSEGVIDDAKFKALYQDRGEFTKEYENLLYGKDNGKIRITQDNAGYLLNLFWALGLGQKNEILEKGEMMDSRYGGPQNFASTGGWTISKGGNVMDHYSHHMFVNLTPEQQKLVDKVSRGIYRPCCGNSTHFPDCNHGMAMLGLLELMASQGASEKDMWKAALAVNSYWFPQTYATIALYMKQNGVDWDEVNPQEILGANYSSAQGYAQISSRVTLPEDGQSQGGSGCSIGGAAPRQQSGCGI